VRTKRKMSITIDSDVLEAIEKLAESRKVAKSQVAEEAFREWIRKHVEKEMAKGYEEMAREDEEFSALVFEAQREIV